MDLQTLPPQNSSQLVLYCRIGSLFELLLRLHIPMESVAGGLRGFVLQIFQQYPRVRPILERLFWLAVVIWLLITNPQIAELVEPIKILFALITNS